MIDVHYWTTPNGHKITMFLEETGLPYKIFPVRIGAGEQFKPSFLKISPNNRIPAIVDNDPPGGGAPISIFESGAILLYLAEKTGQLLPKDPVAKFDAIQWMMVQMTLVGPMFGQYVHFMRFAPKGNDYALDRYRTQVRRVLTTLEQRLGVAPFLGGQSYSIADIATFPWARGIGTFLGNPAEAEYPKLMAWVATINSRPAVTRALAAVDGVRAKTTQFDKAGDEAKDRLFGRGRHAA
jgi:GSH-dependent disulfide-bond oxidoreductase